MIWIFVALSIFFITMILKFKPMVEKSYYRDKLSMLDGFSSYVSDSTLLAHLENVRQEVKVRRKIKQNWNTYINEMQDGWEVIIYNPDNPSIYNKILFSSTNRFWRKAAYVFLIVFALMVIGIMHNSITPTGTPIVGSMKSLLFLLAQLSPVPVLIWLYKTSHQDGRLEGFLNGYIMAHHDMSDENSMDGECNVEIHDSALKDQLPYSHIHRLWE